MLEEGVLQVLVGLLFKRVDQNFINLIIKKRAKEGVPFADELPSFVLTLPLPLFSFDVRKCFYCSFIVKIYL